VWASRYDGPGKAADAAAALAVSPGGEVVFTTGASAGARSGLDYATVAYRADTGARVWVSRYSGKGKRPDEPASIAVSPDGRRVFVTGTSRGAGSGPDYATVAYNARTGARLWVRRYNGVSNDLDSAIKAVVSPDSKTVFVTGQSFGLDLDDYVTVAYNAVTGTRRWLKRYNSPHNGDDIPVGMALAPNGRVVYVSGNAATVAYAAKTGRQLWVSRARKASMPAAIAVSGGAVYVTGLIFGAPTVSYDYFTVAYRASTGAQLWARRYNGTGSSNDAARAVVVSPGGGLVFITGTSIGRAGQGDEFATIAYNAKTGMTKWVRRYDGPVGGGAIAYSIAISTDGRTLYAAGKVFGGFRSNWDFGTVAYATATGNQGWAALHSSPGARTDGAGPVVASPRGGMVFVTGYVKHSGHGDDIATLGYQG
jgi:outer membrane protein assembly factor BamB